MLFNIAVKAENPELVKQLTDELASVCEVENLTVRRWLLNTSQPTQPNVLRIMTHLAKYDATLGLTDFYKQNVAHVTPVKHLVK